MASAHDKEILVRFPGHARAAAVSRDALPAPLKPAERAAAVPDPFLDPVLGVEQSFRLASPARADTPKGDTRVSPGRLLALEATDGTTVFIRADKLREDLARVRPAAVLEDGSLDLSVLRDPEAAARGVTDWIWSGLSVLSLGRDAAVDLALGRATGWLQDWLGESAPDLAPPGASWLGAKALMWAIESRLPGEPGIYQWRGGGPLAATDRCVPGDARLAGMVNASALLFIHGTGSHTLGSFGDLRSGGGAADWEALASRFGDRVFGFEHRTFSESPIDNALALARALPAGTRLSLVTHSRGGLVGDLLCVAGFGDDEIARYRREPPPNTVETPQQKRLRELVAAHEQESLRALRAELADKNFRIERYVRVAAPARGTSLLSDNLDVFLSSLLSLAARFVGALTGPAGGAVMSAFKRIVLEIAEKRIEPRFIPGIEAMLTDAPMARLLAGAQRKQGVDMAIVSGDIEGGHLVKRLGVLFTDWMFFDRVDNDLIVDTESMYAGLAARNDAHYLFDQGASVNHFSYFSNRPTRAALRDWLTVDEPAALPSFTALIHRHEPEAAALRLRAAVRAEPAPDTRPVVILLPGIMGSHLEIRAADRAPGDGDRVWFDFLDLATGGLAKIRFGTPEVREEDLFEMFYGGLADHLAGSHFVIHCPYDWRLPLQAPDGPAARLAAVLRRALTEHPHQPVRLLAHSLGGLVGRAMIAKHPELWAELVQRPGGRLVMLGTPNNGSHLMVEALLGKSGTMRKLARLDLFHGMQWLLDVVADFPGALQLLPRPGFVDAGPSWQREDAPAGDGRHGYLDGALWPALAELNRDRWFGDHIAGRPNPDALAAALDLWQAVLAGNDAPQPLDRVNYVFGKAGNTPCGLALEGGRLKMVGTPEGDGSVSWASGRLDNLPDEQCWFMPADHGGLTNTPEHFAAIADLLHSGTTSRLGRLPALRGAAAATIVYDAPPPVLPTEEELARSIIGTAARRRVAAPAAQSLRVSVTAMDLRFARQPVMCGHYIGDPIAGAEASIDRYLVGGALRQRERLGIYAGDVGSSAIVLQGRSSEDCRRGTGRGAVVVGLGRFGELSMMDIGETVRSGVLRFLLHSIDRQSPDATDEPAQTDLTLASLLIGYNSTAHINVEDSIEMIVRGVLAANRQFAEAMPRTRLRVARLELVELFLDTAISAARAVRELPERIAGDLHRLDATLDAAAELHEGEGARPRLSVSARFGYWPRLIVGDADRVDDTPDDRGEDDARIAPLPVGPRSAPLRPVATRLKYVYLSERARAETVVQQRQPGLIEKLVKQAITQPHYNADLSRTLFQLMMPLDFKAAARDTGRLVLVVDGYTANLPWEMLQADEQPMALTTAMVRKFETTRFRRNPMAPTRRIACVIANPSTQGYDATFGDGPPRPPGEDRLADLPGAAEEGVAIRDLLVACGYDVSYGDGLDALEVFARLFGQPWRILVIAAHGVFRVTARDGSTRTGVVLSDGLLLTAAEVGQMEIVPELVFLNCCHLGAMTVEQESANRLAYSLARELIEIGVRCVVVAGWQVDDQAAKVFATTFFDAFVRRCEPFGMAVFAARRETWEQFPQYNTWGAYQAYGDPEHLLEAPVGDERGWSAAGLVSPVELLNVLACARVDLGHEPRDLATLERDLDALLAQVPPDWVALPEVQAAIGALFGELGVDGFERAHAAYCRALGGGEDINGRVPIRTIRQLADLEARTGEARGDVTLINRAVARLRGLAGLCGPEATLPSPERAAAPGNGPPAAGSVRRTEKQPAERASPPAKTRRTRKKT